MHIYIYTNIYTSSVRRRFNAGKKGRGSQLKFKKSLNTALDFERWLRKKRIKIIIIIIITTIKRRKMRIGTKAMIITTKKISTT